MTYGSSMEGPPITCRTVEKASLTSSLILEKGKVLIETPKVDGGLSVTLSDALYVTELECGLISVSKLTDRGLDVVFSGDKAVVLDKEETILEATKKENVYISNNYGITTEYTKYVPEVSDI